MAQFGYTYRSISSYSSTVRNDTAREPVIKPFSPKSNGSNNSSEGYVTRKTIVPVTTSRPYGGTTTDDPVMMRKYLSPSRAREDDRSTSPLRGSPHKVDQFSSPSHSPTKLQNETNRPQRFSPVADSTGWRHTPQPTPNYSGAAQGLKPIGSGTKNINHDGYINGTNNGYGGAGDYGSNKEGRRPIGSPGTNINHDGYHNTNGYGDKEGRKPVGSTIRNDDHYDGYNNGTNYGYGGGGNKEGLKPIRPGTIRNDNHGGYNGYGGGNYAGNNKEGGMPIGVSNKNDNYEYDGRNGYGSGSYGDDDHYNKREGHKPMARTGNYDGYGIGNGNNKEQRRPMGYGIRKDNYDDDNGNDNDDGNYYNNREGNNHNHKHKYSGGTTGPKISSDWTTAPRKGTQLSEPTHDIEKALELLKMEAAKHENSTMRRTGSPQSRQFSAPINKNSDDRRRGGAPRTSANMTLLSQPPTRGVRVTIIDGRDHSDDDDDIIDSWEAERMFRGSRVW